MVQVGMGATIYLFSDAHAATVVEVERFKSGARKGQVKRILLREDTATRTDPNGISEEQRYTYEPNPNGIEEWYTPHKKNRTAFVSKGNCRSASVGRRRTYFDYSF